ncbi:MAG: DUF2149 domain-containing protein [Firmicutes bacterium]|nr:DUF2149 domain-containing protein [Bacillota bacterium]
MKTNLRQGGLRRRTGESNFNPLEGMANLADCMLVLACGLMLSLIVSWNLDLAVDEQPADSDLSAVEELESTDQQIEDTQAYEQLGVVYRDPETGELYMVMDQDR